MISAGRRSWTMSSRSLTHDAQLNEASIHARHKALVPKARAEPRLLHRTNSSALLGEEITALEEIVLGGERTVQAGLDHPAVGSTLIPEDKEFIPEPPRSRGAFVEGLMTIFCLSAMGKEDPGQLDPVGARSRVQRDANTCWLGGGEYILPILEGALFGVELGVRAEYLGSLARQVGVGFRGRSSSARSLEAWSEPQALPRHTAPPISWSAQRGGSLRDPAAAGGGQSDIWMRQIPDGEPRPHKPRMTGSHSQLQPRTVDGDSLR